ncbi:MAG: hypothetical protein LBH38_03550 [Holosporales bacterium]|jgi:hypothetical protein|nr:hypothetical protein [Holosporales bacterium]
MTKKRPFRMLGSVSLLTIAISAYGMNPFDLLEEKKQLILNRDLQKGNQSLIFRELSKLDKNSFQDPQSQKTIKGILKTLESLKDLSPQTTVDIRCLIYKILENHWLTALPPVTKKTIPTEIINGLINAKCFEMPWIISAGKYTPLMFNIYWWNLMISGSRPRIQLGQTSSQADIPSKIVLRTPSMAFNFYHFLEGPLLRVDPVFGKKTALSWMKIFLEKASYDDFKEQVLEFDKKPSLYNNAKQSFPDFMRIVSTLSPNKVAPKVNLRLLLWEMANNDLSLERFTFFTCEGMRSYLDNFLLELPKGLSCLPGNQETEENFVRFLIMNPSDSISKERVVQWKQKLSGEGWENILLSLFSFDAFMVPSDENKAMSVVRFIEGLPGNIALSISLKGFEILRKEGNKFLQIYPKESIKLFAHIILAQNLDQMISPETKQVASFIINKAEETGFGDDSDLVKKATEIIIMSGFSFQ